jgi:cysteinyl-tRNA synthetase
MHGEHLLVNEGKMAKSEGNFLTLSDIIQKGYNPLAFRYLILTAHYRSRLNFTYESLTSAQNTLNNLYSEISAFDKPKDSLPQYEEVFFAALNNDLDTPKAIATMWELMRSGAPSGAKLASLFKLDKVLGLNLRKIYLAARKIPSDVKALLKERQAARKAKDFNKSDALRQQIDEKGYALDDTPDGVKLKKKF